MFKVGAFLSLLGLPLALGGMYLWGIAIFNIDIDGYPSWASGV
jgi:hypothetical protein